MFWLAPQEDMNWSFLEVLLSGPGALTAIIIDHLITPFGRETGSKKECPLASQLSLVLNWFRSGPDLAMYTSTMEHSNIKSGVLLVQKIAQKLVVKYNFFSLCGCKSQFNIEQQLSEKRIWILSFDKSAFVPRIELKSAVIYTSFD